jgi:hypothetical protein
VSGRRDAIEAVGVVVPAHNEERLLPACLAALGRAGSALQVPVHVLVVADMCTDQTVTAARAGGARVISIRARRVGAARAAGMTELLRLTSGSDPSAVWLATTDADTVVPPGWLRRQLDYAGAGWDVILGTVTVTDWDGHPPHVPVAFAERYASGARPHPHVHGANLGIRASAYLVAGGFRPLRTAEDHALLAAATRAGCPVVQASDIAVQTSGRRLARAPHGFSTLLRTLAGLGITEKAVERPPVILSVGICTGAQRPPVNSAKADAPWAFGDFTIAPGTGCPDVQMIVRLGFGLLDILLAEQA